jgi:SpoVK/Ycf46/Vps4 family AAA+-type ATPase
MAAEVVARALELDLFVVDLARVVSKYIGETEKNLAQIFQAAEDASCILFFDEADALFGKRSEVRDSHDRYANLEISYLLQRIELFEGISILATNLDRNLDAAFVRRLDLTIHFPFPTKAERWRIWEGIWPSRTPLSSDVDFNALAERFTLSGGSIKSAALAAAYLAAADGGIVTEAHLLSAVRSEHEKAGRTMSDEEDAVAVASA